MINLIIDDFKSNNEGGTEIDETFLSATHFGYKGLNAVIS